jgi:phage gp36-like protein
MSYTTNTDVAERLGMTLYVQLTDDAGTGSADEAKVIAARQAAEGEVNSYLGRRYAVPVDTAAHEELGAVLKGITLDLVAYRLHSRHPPVPSDVHAAYSAAIKWLEGIASGRLVLPTVDELPSNPANGFPAAVTGPSRVLSREEMEDL